MRLEQGRAGGQVCNGYGAPYELLPSQHIRFGTIVASQMSCGHRADAQEGRFFALIRDTIAYRVQGYGSSVYLTLTTADGRTIRFRSVSI